jgi:hypothetical protein
MAEESVGERRQPRLMPVQIASDAAMSQIHQHLVESLYRAHNDNHDNRQRRHANTDAAWEIKLLTS